MQEPPDIVDGNSDSYPPGFNHDNEQQPFLDGFPMFPSYTPPFRGFLK